MALEDRIKEEMYVDTESLLEENFDRAQELFEIYEDHTVVLADSVQDQGTKEQVLVHLVAWQYIAEANKEETPALEYEYFYNRLNAGDSTIRDHVTDLVDKGIIRNNEDNNKELVVEQLGDVLDRIEAAISDD